MNDQDIPNSAILSYAGQMTDSDWLNLLIRSVNNQFVDGLALPSFPSDELQTGLVGSSGEHTLREAFLFYRLIKEYSEKLGCRIESKTTNILDFGCGWGRTIRFFLKDINCNNLYGVDVNPLLVDICKNTLHYGNYSLVQPEAPSAFTENSFDIIYAYSVFSHLAEPIHIKWIEEFSRILKPGGLLFATTEPRRFIEYCASLRGKNHEFAWHEALSKSFLDTEATLSDYDNGKFLYSATGGGEALPSSFYGEAIIPPQYVKKEWTKYLKFHDFVDDYNVLPQALIVMQK